MAEELLPCPFCGTIPATKFCCAEVDGYFYYWIYCVECDIQMPAGNAMNERDAIKAWNTRHHQAEKK